MKIEPEMKLLFSTILKAYAVIGLIYLVKICVYE